MDYYYKYDDLFLMAFFVKHPVFTQTNVCARKIKILSIRV